MYIQPLVSYCSEVLITSSDYKLNKLEVVHNQTLRFITGGVKTRTIDELLILTDNGTFHTLIEEKAVILYEKLIRMPNNEY